MTLEEIPNVIQLRLSDGHGGQSYNGRHNGLSGRDEADAHPMGAISGLTEHLARLADDIAVKADTETLGGLSEDVDTLRGQLVVETTTREQRDAEIDSALDGFDDRITALEEGGGSIDPALLDAKQNKIGLAGAPSTPVDNDIWFEAGDVISVPTTGQYATVADVEGVAESVDRERASRIQADNIARSDMQTAISSALDEAKAYADQTGARGLQYKGSVTNAQLAAITHPAVGDLYNILDDGRFSAGVNVAWSGTEWDPMGPTVDLSPIIDHVNARNNPHGVDYGQIGLSAEQLAAIDSGATAALIGQIADTVAKVGTIEEGAEVNELESLSAAGSTLPMSGRTAYLDGLITVGGAGPGPNALIWIELLN